MLTVIGKSVRRMCAGVTRRRALRVGALGLGGISLADLLRLKANGQVRPSARARSVIMIYMPGGPSHIDMYDMKPEAPADYRGEFSPVCSNVPGLDLCELMPGQARIADKFAVVRGVKTFGNGHDPYEILTSDPREASKLPRNPLPSFGSVVSRLRHQDGRAVPHYVGVRELHLLSPSTNDDPETPAYLGQAHAPFRTSGPGLANLSLAAGLSLDRLADRKTLLREFDAFRRGLDDASAGFAALDAYNQQALAIVSGDKVRDAFDISLEPESVRQLYGNATDFLLARRLVEAGVSVVTLPCRAPSVIGDFAHGTLDHWDTHWHHFRHLRNMLPQYDHAITALVTDLYARGLDQQTAVVVWGEFGRTPLVDTTLVPGSAGRGHWPDAGFALFAGGGLSMGKIVGATDKRAERSIEAPFTPSHVLATIYQVLGIDSAQTILDHAGRPRYILDEREPIRELL